MTELSLMKLPSDEFHWTVLMISQHWFRLWLGAVRQQAITWAHVDPDFCHHMASLGQNELTHWPLRDVEVILQMYCSNSIYALMSWALILWNWFLMSTTELHSSKLVQVMACCHQATSHYLSQCWPRSLSPYGVPRTPWVIPCDAELIF